MSKNEMPMFSCAFIASYCFLGHLEIAWSWSISFGPTLYIETKKYPRYRFLGSLKY